MNNSKWIGYWTWLFKGSGGKPGFYNLFDGWIFLHLIIGPVLAWIVRIDLQTAANTVLLPLAGILIGLSFAWAGNAQALLQSEEIERLSEHHKGGYVEYLYAYQLAIMIILTTLVFWAFAGLHIFDQLWPTGIRPRCYFAVKAVLFSFSSFTIRECWQVVMSAQWLLQTRKQIKELFENKDKQPPK